MVLDQNNVHQIQRLIPRLSEEQIYQLERFTEHIQVWNEKINVISRKDMDHITEHHILPSLVLAKVIPLQPGNHVLDIGTGGGFPGIPLGIVFPKARFCLIDSIGKKVGIVSEAAKTLDLSHVRAKQIRAESLKESFDFVTGRAVTALPTFLEWADMRLSKTSKNPDSGVFYLKGGALEEALTTEEIEPKQVYPLSDYLDGDFYKEKYVIHFAARDVRRFAHKRRTAR